MTIDYKLPFIRKYLVRVINKNYDRSVKKILSEPTMRNPHTTVSFSIHLSPATGEKTLSTQLYSARLTRQEKRKDSKDMQGYLAYGFIAFAGSITKRTSLYSIFISSALVHLLTILCKHLYYFQAGGKQLDFLLPSSIF